MIIIIIIIATAAHLRQSQCVAYPSNGGKSKGVNDAKKYKASFRAILYGIPYT